jgi:hypothetical protein
MNSMANEIDHGDDPQPWSARAVATNFGHEVELIATDGARIILHPDIARELGNQLRGAADECEVLAARKSKGKQLGEPNYANTGDVVARLLARSVELIDAPCHSTPIIDPLCKEAAAEITRLRTLLSSSRGEQGWRTMDSAPTDGTHIIGNTQWGAHEIWWHKDTYEGEYWTDEGDSEPEPTGWIPMPGSVPASLAGQVPDGYAKALQEISTLAAQFDDEREAGYIAVAKLGRIARAAIVAGVSSPDQDKELRERYFEARDALYQFNYPPDPKLLREIADEIDCGTNCEHCHTEWDTNAHICSRTESPEGCAFEKANCLREFAKAVEVCAAAPSPPGAVPTSLAGQVPDGYVLVPKEPTSEMLEAADAEYPRGSLIEKKLDRRKYKAMLSAAPQPTAGGDAHG